MAEKLKLNYSVKRNGNLDDIRNFHKQKYYIIVCYFIPEDKVNHYAVVNNITSKNISLNDSWYGENYNISFNKFYRQWKSNSKYKSETNIRWFIAMKKSPNIK